MNQRFPVLLVVLASLLVFPGASCPSGSSPRPQPPTLRFSRVEVNKTQANPGDLITVSWDYEAPEKLRAQGLRFIAILFEGSVQDPRELQASERSFTFPFNGPVTVELSAESIEPGKGDKVAFSIEYAENLFIEADIDMQYAAGYPVLNGVQGFTRFTHVSGFFDADYSEGCPDRNGNGQRDPGECNRANGFIDGLALDPALSQIFEPDLGFFALTSPPEEGPDGTFKMRRGRNYPLLPANFLNQPDPYAPGRRFREVFLPQGINHADGIVFGGAVKISGEAFPIKLPQGEGEGFRGDVKFDFLFITLVLRSRTDGDPATQDPLLIADIQLGHLTKGLVVHLFQWDPTPDPRGITAYTATYSQQPAGFYAAHGSFDLANLGMFFTPADGTPIFSSVLLHKVRWRVPFVSDQDLLPEARCGDGVDNDGDVVIDCMDPGCLGQSCATGVCHADGHCG